MDANNAARAARPFVRLLYGIPNAITHILACFTHLTRLVRYVAQLVEILSEKNIRIQVFLNGDCW